LALIQTHMVADELSALHRRCSFEVEWMTTVGDRNQQTPLHLLTPYSQQQPAKSLWTDELEARLMNGGFDILIHSLKDVPTTLKGGCEIACMLKREDPRDALVVKQGLDYKTLEDLPDGSVVGTGSVRRVAQLKRAFPKLVFEDMRGNLNTRLTKLDKPESNFAALILAISGLTRLGSAHRVTSPIGSPELYHAVGQGALGVEIRSGDARVRETLRGIGHWPTEWRCGAERGCLRVLEGGCSVPVGVESELEELDPTEGDGNNERDEIFASQTFGNIQEDSPMLWFSGIVDAAHSLPVSEPSTPSVFAPNTPIDLPSDFKAFNIVKPLPPLRPRRARMTLRACVTSLDGAEQVVFAPPPVIVRNYQEAERWGEICAQEIKETGGKEILEEVGRIRRERERRDFERALERSRKEIQDNSSDTQSRDEHVGLQGLIQTLAGQ
jgi:hydroxymethylbilane synthase